MNKNYIQWYLREFYTEPLISKEIWLLCKNYSLDDNLVIYCKDSESAKYFISSLLLQYANNGKRNKPFKKFYGFDARKLRLWIYECKYNKLSPRIQLL